MKPIAICVAVLLSGCQALKSGSVVADSSAPVLNPDGIYSYDFATERLVQLVAVEPTSELIKYTFHRVAGGLQIHYIEDQTGQRNLHAALIEGEATATSQKILGHDDLNGPAMCVATGRLLFGQLANDAVQVMSLALGSDAAPERIFSQPHFVAGDLHCREGVAGFVIAGLDCPPSQNLGECFANPANDSLSSIFQVVGGQAVRVSRPELDAQVSAMPRLKLFHRGDVDASTAKLSDGGTAVGFSRLLNSPALAAADTPSYLKDMGYQKLMVKRLGAEGETEIDLAAVFRKAWQLGPDEIIDFVATGVDLREQATTPGTLEFVVKTLDAVRGDDGHRFDGIMYGRLAIAELGKPQAALLEARPLLTGPKLSCEIWKKHGIRADDGNVYAYSIAFPRFQDLQSTTLIFSTAGHRIGKYGPENGGTIVTDAGDAILVRDFGPAFCGFELPHVTF